MARWMVVVLWLVMGCASEDHGLLRYQRFSEDSTRGGREDVASVHGAVLHSVDEVKGSLGESRAALAVLQERPSDFGGRGFDGVFGRYLEQGTRQLTWARGELGSAMVWMGEASEVEDPDMELALLRMAGPRLQSAMFGALLAATWVDFLQLANAVLRHCAVCGSEKLFVDLDRVQRRMEPSLKELASKDSARIEAAATAMPVLMGTLTREFEGIRRETREAMEVGGKVMVAVQVLELAAMVSTLKMSLPRLPPAAPMTMGAGLVLSSGGVMTGSRIVVSAEWVEMMRRLVQAGVISSPAVSAAVRIHGGQVLMAQANQELPEGVREALGDSPEVRGMRVTDRAGAGMAEPPKHHVLPREHRKWFEQRGFKGDMDIDQFCVRLEQAHHEAIHGGGNWKLGRTWPDEWNRMIMRTLHQTEALTGRVLTRNQVLDIVAERMKAFYIPIQFTKGASR
ncbi:DUF2380 domain-containing protein [Myxococcus faecalis]|uniref:DUF2380 domain-containing protein n=1 Tax=Myxococcus faecalis TaxID=3115646 RepID=UPI003CF25CF8